MRVVIDCRWIRSVKLDGIGRYTFELVRELIALPERDTIYILLVHDREVAAWLEKECQLDTFTHVRLHRLKYPILSFSDVRHLRGDLEALQPDIVFCPNYLSWPFSSRFRTIMVVHDLIPFIMPEVCTTPKWKLFYGTPWFARSILNRADTIVTVSAHTAHDIQARFHIPEDQIRVIPEGVADRFSLPVDEARKNLIRERYHLPEKYILCVSRQQPYKNLLGLIRAYMQLPDELKVRYMLVLTGESHRLYSGRLSEAIDPLVLSYLAVFTGFVGDDDLPGLYQMASLFVLPSLYEGFGLPVLEAMAAGCPVACSRTA
ncbi:hypothetical protein AUK40_02305, partial [Candidatus Wirthbacteria bacterium CG2_30_54_11]